MDDPDGRDIPSAPRRRIASIPCMVSMVFCTTEPGFDAVKVGVIYASFHEPPIRSL